MPEAAAVAGCRLTVMEAGRHWRETCDKTVEIFLDKRRDAQQDESNLFLYRKFSGVSLGHTLSTVSTRQADTYPRLSEIENTSLLQRQRDAVKEDLHPARSSQQPFGS